jgi:hypothetical protein
MPRLNGSDRQYPERCVRCDSEARAFTMSIFNRDWICLACRDDESDAPGFEGAARAEIEAVRRGVFNYPGMGLSEEDKAFLKSRREARS